MKKNRTSFGKVLFLSFYCDITCCFIVTLLAVSSYKMEKQQHKLWLEKYLPMVVRLTKILKTTSNHPDLRIPIEALEKEYTKTETTILSLFRNVMKAHIEGIQHEKIWYLEYCIDMSLVSRRDDPKCWWINHCPNFLSYTDKINNILDELQIEKVEPFRPVPPIKTRDDLTTEHGKKMYDLMEKWLRQIVKKDPNSGFELSLAIYNLLDNELGFFDENGKLKNECKLYWGIACLIDEDESVKATYFDKPPE